MSKTSKIIAKSTTTSLTNGAKTLLGQYGWSIHNISTKEHPYLARWLAYGEYPHDVHAGCRYIVSATTTLIPHDYVNNPKKIHLDDPQELVNVTATAELTLGLLIACARNIKPAIKHIEHNRWDRYALGAPRMLSRSTLLIIGHGRVGSTLKKLATPLYKDVCFSTVPGVLMDLLPDADAVAVCASANDRPIISYQELAAMKSTAVLVNTSQGCNVDAIALLQALEDGQIHSAGIDVARNDWQDSLEREALMAHANTSDKLILTPHIAGSTQDAWEETQCLVIKKLERAYNEDRRSGKIW